MSEMVERVARVLHSQNRDFTTTPTAIGYADMPWEQLSETSREGYRAIARAAIAAMKFPTLPMIVASGNLPAGSTNHEIWQAMIEAASV